MTLTQKLNINNLRNRKSGATPSRTRKKRIGSLLPLIGKFLMVLIVLLGVGFVASINDLSIKGFVLAEMKSELSELTEENEKLELKTMALESYESINERAQELKMVRVDKIEYITTIDESVAKK